ncbi:translesion DNA synthesis-associated protein ImuA [Undibacterium arcticum]|uniref:Translesion DNA synthesis-associated protein ImuA n=1 Tax=Undibacterium arcticum TaxID=1762892 RepID=A0ABV7F6S1_9BURK
MPQLIWRANQMARYRSATLSSGFRSLDDELPEHGWPRSALIELLLQQPGIGEIQLLKPALVSLSRTRRIALVQPPHLPDVAACRKWGIATGNLLWLPTTGTADALWATEQILRNGSCGAVLLWLSHVRTDALRRLHLAAQSSDTMFWLLRPAANSQDPSPSPLRLVLQPAVAGIQIDILKRRGPQADHSIYFRLSDMPVGPHQDNVKHHARLDRRLPATYSAGSSAAVVV